METPNTEKDPILARVEPRRKSIQAGWVAPILPRSGLYLNRVVSGVGDLLAGEGPEYEDFRNRIIGLTGIPSAGQGG